MLCGADNSPCYLLLAHIHISIAIHYSLFPFCTSAAHRNPLATKTTDRPIKLTAGKQYMGSKDLLHF